MSKTVLIESVGAAPHAACGSLDLKVERGCLCLVGSDEPLTIDYLRMCAGVVPAQRGSVTILGERPLDEPYGGAQLRRRVGYVTPRAPLLSVLDGVRNVMLPALYHRLAPEPQVSEMCRELLDEMGDVGDHHQLPALMSELQRRMLLIARALILQPQLLFLEQPLLGLDGAPCDRLRDYIYGAVMQRVRALVIASNDPLLVGKADQLVFISKQKNQIFADWRGLSASSDNDVQAFLLRERRACSVLQG